MVALVLGAAAASGQIDLDSEGRLTLSGDVRLRAELDWSSRRADGSLRDDRERLRLRTRLGLDWRPSSGLRLGVRVRTGDSTAQQSPHLTFHDFSGNSTDDADFGVDRLFVRLDGGDTQTTLGRQGNPFWKQNELFWDDDVALTGATVGQDWKRAKSEARLSGGYYWLPDGMARLAGTLAAGQLRYTWDLPRLDFTAATGLFFLDGEPGARHLRNGNGARDYHLWTMGLQARFNADALPIVLGVDVSHNFKDYSPDSPDPVIAANHDETTGFVASVVLGQTKDPGDWLAGYYYARIETLSVNASFAQDDWIRWGSGGQTDSSDLEGHELRFAVALPRSMNLVARLYLVEALTSRQDGRRFRLDWNYRF